LVGKRYYGVDYDSTTLVYYIPGDRSAGRLSYALMKKGTCPIRSAASFVKLFILELLFQTTVFVPRVVTG
jgi:hypothetical protein